MTDKEILNKAKETLYQNLVRGYNKRQKIEYTFIKPSPQHYTFQYFWDSCFHSFILTTLGKTDLAKKCFRSLMAMQRKNGFIGHIHYWNNVWPARATDIFQNNPSLGFNLLRSHTSALIQPPMLAMALLRIWETTEDLSFLKEMWPKIDKYYSFLSDNRDFDSDGLLSIITSFESGMDWKPSYDKVIGFSDGKANKKLFWKMIYVDFHNFLRNYNIEKIKRRDKFLVKDTAFNTIYYMNLKAMVHLSHIMDDFQNKQRYRQLADKVKKSIGRSMYDKRDAAFYDLHSRKRKKLRTLTPTIFFPLAIDDYFEKYGETVLKRHLFNKKEFYTRFPIPSTAIDEPAFDPDESLYLWRGPTWIFHNWFIYKFILKKRYPKQAEYLLDTVKKLIEKSGFREYYNPFTAEGHGAERFTWSALIVDMMRKDLQ